MTPGISFLSSVIILSNDGDFFSQYSNDLTGDTAVNSPVVIPVVLDETEAEAEAET